MSGIADFVFDKVFTAIASLSRNVLRFITMLYTSWKSALFQVMPNGTIHPVISITVALRHGGISFLQPPISSGEFGVPCGWLTAKVS